ncbi:MULTISPECIES: WYL domain-containing protein [Colwellia]|uniref:WYL domain-containing protein n=1 Tax=Colwellia marinimaniae TaxID=1513592 RepID=A0ABQ0MR25_9GAMM|nr:MULTISPECIES: WYL domain-containing protein [Colwellia]GAW94642.1 WYL domain-containing protein [Colwellia marinimaniae]
MSKEARERFTFINNVVGWEGQINSTHIATKFQLSRQAASSILKQYREHFPTYLQYDLSQKAYIATDDFNHSFIHSNALNTFSKYLAAIEFTDSTDLVSSVFLEVEAPLRNINPLQIRPILRAIREQLQIDIGYISLSSPNYLDRIIQPHALIFDGLRWHVRAYCNKNGEFRDFTLSRFNGEATFEGKASHSVAQDDQWNTIVDVAIEADPRFNDQQKGIIEQDFQMQQGQKIIPTRAALVNYLLRRLRIDSYKNTPEEQQIVLTRESRQAITPYLPQPV